MNAQPLIRMREAVTHVQLSRSQINRLIAIGEFPAPIRLSKRAVAFRAADIQAWLLSRPTARNTTGGAT